MNSAAIEKSHDSGGTNENAAWHHFLKVGMAFLGLETVVLVLVGGPFFENSDSAIRFLAIAGVGGLGYLALGILAGSGLSIVFIAVPIVIAVAIGGTVADGSTASETPLYVSWTFLTLYFFAPLWLFGLLISFLLRSYPPAPE